MLIYSVNSHFSCRSFLLVNYKKVLNEGTEQRGFFLKDDNAVQGT